MFAILPIALLFFQEPKLATIEGTVTHSSSKVPIRKAKVTVSSLRGQMSNTAETGDDGKFIVKDVQPGRYRITAERSGYETTAYRA